MIRPCSSILPVLSHQVCGVVLNVTKSTSKSNATKWFSLLGNCSLGVTDVSVMVCVIQELADSKVSWLTDRIVAEIKAIRVMHYALTQHQLIIAKKKHPHGSELTKSK